MGAKGDGSGQAQPIVCLVVGLPVGAARTANDVTIGVETH